MKKAGIALLLFTLFLFIVFNKHSRDDYSSYHSVLWADASGYYVYNTLWFIYGNDGRQMPDSIEHKTGTGFSVDSLSGHVITKYTSGVALLQAPFFLAAHLLSGPLGYPSDGFSPIYHRAIMVAGAFYGLMGLLFSFLFLKNYFSEKISLITVAAFFLSTNLFYYTLDASGFLHVYAFFLISAIAWLTTRISSEPRFTNILALALVFALAVLIRPTNILLFVFLVFFQSNEKSSVLQALLNNKKHFIIASSLSLILFIPQLIYWNQSYGSPVTYSYGEEGFDHLLSPKILSVWFSTRNGLFTWAPVLLLSVMGMTLSAFNKNRNGIVITVIFLASTYVFSSWWNYWFGCAMGARSFVEYYPLLMFPFAFALSKIQNKLYLAAVGLFILICVWANMSIIYYYDGCFYGGEWDWKTFFNLLTD